MGENLESGEAETNGNPKAPHTQSEIGGGSMRKVSAPESSVLSRKCTAQSVSRSRPNSGQLTRGSNAGEPSGPQQESATDKAALKVKASDSLTRTSTGGVASTSVSTNNLVCKFCSKDFLNQSSLNKHMTSHSDIRPHTCPDCNKSFKRVDHLTSHTMTHRLDRPYVCKIGLCMKRYKEKRQLRKHYESCHLLYDDGQPEIAGSESAEKLNPDSKGAGNEQGGESSPDGGGFHDYHATGTNSSRRATLNKSTHAGSTNSLVRNSTSSATSQARGRGDLDDAHVLQNRQSQQTYPRISIGAAIKPNHLGADIKPRRESASGPSFKGPHDEYADANGEKTTSWRDKTSKFSPFEDPQRAMNDPNRAMAAEAGVDVESGSTTQRRSGEMFNPFAEHPRRSTNDLRQAMAETHGEGEHSAREGYGSDYYNAANSEDTLSRNRNHGDVGRWKDAPGAGPRGPRQEGMYDAHATGRDAINRHTAYEREVINRARNAHDLREMRPAVAQSGPLAHSPPLPAPLQPLRSRGIDQPPFGKHLLGKPPVDRESHLQRLYPHSIGAERLSRSSSTGELEIKSDPFVSQKPLVAGHAQMGPNSARNPARAGARSPHMGIGEGAGEGGGGLLREDTTYVGGGFRGMGRKSPSLARMSPNLGHSLPNMGRESAAAGDLSPGIERSSPVKGRLPDSHMPDAKALFSRSVEGRSVDGRDRGGAADIYAYEDTDTAYADQGGGYLRTGMAYAGARTPYADTRHPYGDADEAYPDAPANAPRGSNAMPRRHTGTSNNMDNPRARFGRLESAPGRPRSVQPMPNSGLGRPLSVLGTTAVSEGLKGSGPEWSGGVDEPVGVAGWSRGRDAEVDNTRMYSGSGAGAGAGGDMGEFTQTQTPTDYPGTAQRRWRNDSSGLVRERGAYIETEKGLPRGAGKNTQAQPPAQPPSLPNPLNAQYKPRKGVVGNGLESALNSSEKASPRKKNKFPGMGRINIKQHTFKSSPYSQQPKEGNRLQPRTSAGLGSAAHSPNGVASVTDLSGKVRKRTDAELLYADVTAELGGPISDYHQAQRALMCEQNQRQRAKDLDVGKQSLGSNGTQLMPHDRPVYKLGNTSSHNIGDSNTHLQGEMRTHAPGGATTHALALAQAVDEARQRRENALNRKGGEAWHSRPTSRLGQSRPQSRAYTRLESRSQPQAHTPVTGVSAPVSLEADVRDVGEGTVAGEVDINAEEMEIKVEEDSGHAPEAKDTQAQAGSVGEIEEEAKDEMYVYVDVEETSAGAVGDADKAQEQPRVEEDVSKAGREHSGEGPSVMVVPEGDIEDPSDAENKGILDVSQRDTASGKHSHVIHWSRGFHDQNGKYYPGGVMVSHKSGITHVGPNYQCDLSFLDEKNGVEENTIEESGGAQTHNELLWQPDSVDDDSLNVILEYSDLLKIRQPAGMKWYYEDILHLCMNAPHLTSVLVSLLDSEVRAKYRTVPQWTDEEKTLFRDGFSKYQKDFRAISQEIQTKSIADVVAYYYQWKKDENTDYRYSLSKRIPPSTPEEPTSRRRQAIGNNRSSYAANGVHTAGASPAKPSRNRNRGTTKRKRGRKPKRKHSSDSETQPSGTELSSSSDSSSEESGDSGDRDCTVVTDADDSENALSLDLGEDEDVGEFTNRSKNGRFVSKKVKLGAKNTASATTVTRSDEEPDKPEPNNTGSPKAKNDDKPDDKGEGETKVEESNSVDEVANEPGEDNETLADTNKDTEIHTLDETEVATAAEIDTATTGNDGNGGNQGNGSNAQGNAKPQDKEVDVIAAANTLANDIISRTLGPRNRRAAAARANANANANANSNANANANAGAKTNATTNATTNASPGLNAGVSAETKGAADKDKDAVLAREGDAPKQDERIVRNVAESLHNPFSRSKSWAAQVNISSGQNYRQILPSPRSNDLNSALQQASQRNEYDTYNPSMAAQNTANSDAHAKIAGEQGRHAAGMDVNMNGPNKASATGSGWLPDNAPDGGIQADNNLMKSVNAARVFAHECSECQEKESALWRKGVLGGVLCDACYKKHTVITRGQCGYCGGCESDLWLKGEGVAVACRNCYETVVTDNIQRMATWTPADVVAYMHAHSRTRESVDGRYTQDIQPTPEITGAGANGPEGDGVGAPAPVPEVVVRTATRCSLPDTRVNLPMLPHKESHEARARSQPPPGMDKEPAIAGKSGTDATDMGIQAQSDTPAGDLQSDRGIEATDTAPTKEIVAPGGSVPGQHDEVGDDRLELSRALQQRVESTQEPDEGQHKKEVAYGAQEPETHTDQQSVYMPQRHQQMLQQQQQGQPPNEFAREPRIGKDLKRREEAMNRTQAQFYPGAHPGPQERRLQPRPAPRTQAFGHAQDAEASPDMRDDPQQSQIRGVNTYSPQPPHAGRSPHERGQERPLSEEYGARPRPTGPVGDSVASPQVPARARRYLNSPDMGLGAREGSHAIDASERARDLGRDPYQDRMSMKMNASDNERMALIRRQDDSLRERARSEAMRREGGDGGNGGRDGGRYDQDLPRREPSLAPVIESRTAGMGHNEGGPYDPRASADVGTAPPGRRLGPGPGFGPGPGSVYSRQLHRSGTSGMSQPSSTRESLEIAPGQFSEHQGRFRGQGQPYRPMGDSYESAHGPRTRPPGASLRSPQLGGEDHARQAYAQAQTVAQQDSRLRAREYAREQERKMYGVEHDRDHMRCRKGSAYGRPAPQEMRVLSSGVGRSSLAADSAMPGLSPALSAAGGGSGGTRNSFGAGSVQSGRYGAPPQGGVGGPSRSYVQQQQQQQHRYPPPQHHPQRYQQPQQPCGLGQTGPRGSVDDISPGKPDMGTERGPPRGAPDLAAGARSSVSGPLSTSQQQQLRQQQQHAPHQQSMYGRAKDMGAGEYRAGDPGLSERPMSARRGRMHADIERDGMREREHERVRGPMGNERGMGNDHEAGTPHPGMFAPGPSPQMQVQDRDGWENQSHLSKVSPAQQARGGQAGPPSAHHLEVQQRYGRWPKSSGSAYFKGGIDEHEREGETREDDARTHFSHASYGAQRQLGRQQYMQQQQYLKNRQPQDGPGNDYNPRPGTSPLPRSYYAEREMDRDMPPRAQGDRMREREAYLRRDRERVRTGGGPVVGMRTGAGAGAGGPYSRPGEYQYGRTRPGDQDQGQYAISSQDARSPEQTTKRRGDWE